VDNRDHAAVAAGLSPHSREVFESLPLNFKYELLLERDPHGNVQVGLVGSLVSVVIRWSGGWSLACRDGGSRC
jgi:hypothetical protein